MLRVQVAEIPEEGLQLEVEDKSWFPDRDFTRIGDLQASVFLFRQSGRVLVTGSISVIMVLECDRCLEEFESSRKIDLQLAIELDREDEALQSADHELDHNEMDVIFLSEPVVDIGDILYQQIVLALPQKSLCRKDCRGFCGGCGVDLNKEECHCSQDDDGSPFGALAHLLKEKKTGRS